MKTAERRAAGPDEMGREAERARIRAGLRYCLWVFLGLRVGLSVVALAGVALLPSIDNAVGPPGWPASEVTAGWHNLVTAWERFDALWYLRIATGGYVDGDGSAVFFPLYPLLVRGLSPILGGHPLAAAFLVSHLATFGSMVALYFLTAGELDERTARRTVLYLAVFPTSFFLLAPYSESLFLLLVLVSVWAARRGVWWAAGLAGAGASATRNLGVLLVLPLAVEAVHQWRERGGSRVLVRGLLWSAAAGAGALAYLAFWQGVAGDALAPINQQANWQREGSFPAATLVWGTVEAFRFIGVYPGGYHMVDWLIVVPAVAGAVWVAFRTRPVFGVYTWASLAAPLAYVFLPRPFMSFPRFLLAVFPVLWPWAVLGIRRRGVHEALVAVSAGLLALLTVLFVNWYYVF
ncbi:MAG: mannosyltransferase family protein [Actinomycetota bacterium]